MSNQVYTIEIIETLSRQVKIKANSIEEALIDVKEEYQNQNIVLDYQDYLFTDFVNISPFSLNDD